MVWCGWLLCRQLDDPARAPKSPLSDNTRFHRGNASLSLPDAPAKVPSQSDLPTFVAM